MVRFKLRANGYGQYYFPKAVRDEFGRELELEPNLKTGVIYPAGTPPDVVLKSLRALVEHFKQRVELEREADNRRKEAVLLGATGKVGDVLE